MLESNKEIYPAHVSERVAPNNLEKNDNVLFEHEFTSLICSTSYLILKNVHVLDDTVFDLSNFTFYPSYTHVYGSFSIKDKLKRLKSFFKNKIIVDKAIWITQNWTWMYFHWLTDALPRLIALEDHIEKHIVLLPESYKKHSYIIDSLEILGYDSIFYPECNRVFVKKLALPSHTASPGNYNAYYLNILRGRFLKNKTPFRKIFISRSQANQRFILNEDEVTNILLSFGFEVHIFENYTLDKQIELMNETSVLLGLHGAGLANMLFMPENGNIIELRNQGDKHNNCYFSMASALKHSYFYLQGLGDSSQTASVNIKIDTLELKNLLNLLFYTNNPR